MFVDDDRAGGIRRLVDDPELKRRHQRERGHAPQQHDGRHDRRRADRKGHDREEQRNRAQRHDHRTLEITIGETALDPVAECHADAEEDRHGADVESGTRRTLVKKRRYVGQRYGHDGRLDGGDGKCDEHGSRHHCTGVPAHPYASFRAARRKDGEKDERGREANAAVARKTILHPIAFPAHVAAGTPATMATASPGAATTACALRANLAVDSVTSGVRR
ncbi:hypothetical protein ACMGDM_19400 [Sphingomonas sp. DT-51]|uniref:hypothetical protein n=1 Tax=Sphingomonas sp. DT-51 TaxID=3396165 RepID=UPI003F1D6C2F